MATYLFLVALVIATLILLWLLTEVNSHKTSDSAITDDAAISVNSLTCGTILSASFGILQFFSFSAPFTYIDGYDFYAPPISGFELIEWSIVFAMLGDVPACLFLLVPLSIILSISRIVFNYRKPLPIVWHSTKVVVCFSLGSLIILLLIAGDPIQFWGVWLAFMCGVGMVLGNLVDIYQPKGEGISR